MWEFSVAAGARCGNVAGGGRGPGSVSGAGSMPGASVVDVGAVLLLLLSLVSGCSLMLFTRLRLGLLGPGCCFAAAAAVCVGCFLLLPAALGLTGVLPFCVDGPRSWAAILYWSVRFGVALLHLFPPIRLFLTHIRFRGRSCSRVEAFECTHTLFLNISRIQFSTRQVNS